MTKTSAAIGSGLFLFLAPGIVAGLAPWWISGWQVGPPFLGLQLFRFAGVVLLAAAILGLLDSFVRFAIEGLGTPAPVAPTQSLVVTGLYRYVRNPMYVAVESAILGQAFLLSNWSLLAYAAVIGLLFHVFVLLYEEPTLRRSFGNQYASYCAAVPRWIPRVTPWSGS